MTDTFMKRAILIYCVLWALLGAPHGQGQIISEFMAINNSTLFDEDGDASDWIEIYNPESTAMDMEGYYLTDDPDNLSQWRFPAIQIPSGGFLVLFASGKDRRNPAGKLHTNFKLSSEGEYLGLIRPDGVTVEYEYAPRFPEQVTDISYGKGEFSETTLVGEGDTLRFRIPGIGEADATWTAPDYDDSAWSPGKMGLGFAPIPRTGLVSHWTFDVDGADMAGNNDGILKNGASITNEASVGAGALSLDGVNDYVSLGDPVSLQIEGEITITAWIRTAVTGGIRYIVAKGYNTSPNGEIYLRLSGDLYEMGVWDGSNAAASGAGAGADVDQWTHLAGLYDGANWKLYRNGVLIQSTASTQGAIPVGMGWGIGGRADGSVRFFGGQIDDVYIFNRALSESDIWQIYNGSGPGAQTNVSDEMLGVNTSAWTRSRFSIEDPTFYNGLLLKVRYEDGFVAFLNGWEIARGNAPASLDWNSAAASDRPENMTGVIETFQLENAIGYLQAGPNVLAVQGLNDSAHDENFLISTELTGALDATVGQYYVTATPGAFNQEGALGVVGMPDFSHGSGSYNSTFNVTLSCPTDGAWIRYTLNGEEPTETTGEFYTFPINIYQSQVIRAIAYKPGWASSRIATKSYLFLNSVVNQPTLPSGFPAYWDTYNGSSHVPGDYEMDPFIKNHSTWGTQLIPSLQSLPIMSIVTANDNLFDAQIGIYSNPEQSGPAWERPAYAEWIESDGTVGFGVDAGLRIQGGWFRNPDNNQKHSLRLLFKTQYGPSKLRYNLFDWSERTIPSFDTITLRANANDGYSWAGHSEVQFIRDEFGRRSQLALGHPSGHGTFGHLFINGLYWGFFNPVERPAAAFAARYFGGDKEEWDALNSGAAIDGTTTAWNALLSQCRAGLASDAAYQKVQGNNPDGTNRTDYECYIDIDNYIDYMICNLWVGNSDWPFKNWYAARRRVDSTGFKFFMWDAEWALLMNSGLNTDRTEDVRGVAEPYGALRANAEFRLRFADHVRKHLFHDGAMTTDAVIKRYQGLADEVEAAVVAETARWGDMHREPPYTKSEWETARDNVLNNYLPYRNNIVIQQFKKAGLYPNLTAPDFAIDGLPQHGGQVVKGAALTLAPVPAAGMIYYTLNGTDPRRSSSADNGLQTLVLAAENAPKRILVPTRDIGSSWRSILFDDADWDGGVAIKGVGYETGNGYQAYFEYDTQTAMSGVSTTCYIRIPFTVRAEDLDQIRSLTLRMRYDDGFIAYINGQKAISANEPAGEPAWNSASSVQNSDANAINLQDFNISAMISSLVAGDNVLAIHGLNISVGSSDFLISPELVAMTGAINDDLVTSSALLYDGPVTLTDSIRVKARAWDGTEWSALTDAFFSVPVAPEAVIITEIMANPKGDDANSEWIELFNTSDTPINISGWTLTDNGGDRAVLDSATPLWIPARGYRVVGASTDSMLNGGASVDYAYGAAMTLSNEADEIFLTQGDTVIHSVGYGAFTPLPQTVATVIAMRPDEGEAFGMAQNYYDGPVDWWIDQVSPYGPWGNEGTPGADNDGVYIGAGSDTEPPRLMEARFVRGDRIQLRFDDILSTTPAEQLTHYSVNQGVGAPVSVQKTSAMKVELDFPSPLTPGIAYTVTIQGLEDLFGNVMPVPVDVTVTYEAPHVLITEIMYHPPAGDAFEYLELHNPDLENPLDLEGMALTDGVDFVFPEGAIIEPEGYLLVTPCRTLEDQTVFRAHYGLSDAVPLTGPWTSRLSDGGETLTLRTAPSGVEVLSITYDDARGWPQAPDGGGHSLVPRTSAMSKAIGGALDYGGNWRASAWIGGSPGRMDPTPVDDLIINEVMAHTDVDVLPYDSNDWVELYNLSKATVTLGDYYLSDDITDLTGWRIPAGTLAPGAWTSFDEMTGFHQPITIGFGLNKGGETLFLSWLPPGGPGRVVDELRFKGQENHISVGRWPDGDRWSMKMTPTRGAANTAPIAAPIIAELMYHPRGSDNLSVDDSLGEYIEIVNPTAEIIECWNVAGAWRLDGGVNYIFPEGTMIPPGKRLLVVNFDPSVPADLAAFKIAWGLDNVPCPILGPYGGALSNRTDRVAIEKPEAPDAIGDPVVWVIVDEVIYADQSPWPPEPDGTGPSLHRDRGTVSGNNPSNWFSAPPTPGYGNERPLKNVWIVF